MRFYILCILCFTYPLHSMLSETSSDNSNQTTNIPNIVSRIIQCNDQQQISAHIQSFFYQALQDRIASRPYETSPPQYITYETHERIRPYIRTYQRNETSQQLTHALWRYTDSDGICRRHPMLTNKNQVTIVIDTDTIMLLPYLTQKMITALEQNWNQHTQTHLSQNTAWCLTQDTHDDVKAHHKQAKRLNTLQKLSFLGSPCCLCCINIPINKKIREKEAYISYAMEAEQNKEGIQHVTSPRYSMNTILYLQRQGILPASMYNHTWARMPQRLTSMHHGFPLYPHGSIIISWKKYETHTKNVKKRYAL